MPLLFKNCSFNFQNFLEIKEYKKNALIASEGETCTKLGIILEGEIIISTLAYSDKEYIIKTLHKDELFGEVILFSDNKTYLGDVISNNAKIAFISKENLITLFKDETFLQNYLSIFSNEMANTQFKLKLLSQKNIKDKIMFYLNMHYKKTKSLILKIKSKENLALLLNIPRPSLSRELIILKNEGLIDYGKNYISLINPYFDNKK